MRIRIKTAVDGHYKEVMRQFDRKLFEALAPKGISFELKRFDGSKKGDTVHLKFGSPLNTDWISEITEDGMDEKQAWFVDEGVKVPFGIRLWKHRHIVENSGKSSSTIVDDITYGTSNKLLDILMYPFLFAAFYPRKAIYRKYFKWKT